MAIIHFTFRPAEVEPSVRAKLEGVHYATGSSRLNRETNKYEDTEGPVAYWVWKSHEGLCLRDREMNGYDDSDFYMLVWNEEKGEPEEILFASTRGWTYPSMGSYVDATPEVVAKYEAWLAARAAERKALHRKAAAAKLRALRAAIREEIGTGETYVRALKLRQKIGPALFDRLVAFLGKNLRSKFKLSMKAQVLAWFADPAPKFDTPLSRRQWEWIG